MEFKKGEKVYVYPTIIWHCESNNRSIGVSVHPHRVIQVHWVSIHPYFCMRS